MKTSRIAAFLVSFAMTVSPLQARAEDKRPGIFLKALASARDLRVGGDDPWTTSIPVFGGGFETGLLLGSSPKSPWRGFVALDYEFGSMKGLRAHTLFAKVSALCELGSSGIGDWNIGGHIAGLVIERSSSAGEVIGHWGIGVHTGFDFHVIRKGDFRLFVSPELDATILPHKIFIPRSLYYGGSLGIGVHF